MNREIKFRIRLVCIKDGDGYKIGDKLTMFNEPFDRLNGVAFYPINSQVWEVVSHEQFTGLTDKNGKEIHESDIVKMFVTEKTDTYFGTGKVIFHMGCFMVEWIDDKEAMMDLLSMTKTGRPYFQEIIGNIYENPELLNP